MLGMYALFILINISVSRQFESFHVVMNFCQYLSGTTHLPARSHMTPGRHAGTIPQAAPLLTPRDDTSQ